MILDEPLFGERLKTLNTIDVNLARRKILLVIYRQMPISATHQGIIAFIFVCIDDASSPYLFDGKVK